MTVLVAATAGAAHAQTFTAPRFEALEQQQLTVEQQQLDALERERQHVLLAPVDPSRAPDPSASAASRAVRQLEIQRDMDRIRLEGDRERARSARERVLAEATLPNRRIAPSSILVVRDPSAYGLPPPPRGQFYARLEGRYVLVDEMSELVVEVLPRTPFGPDDAPPQPLPPLQAPVPVAPGAHGSP